MAKVIAVHGATGSQGGSVVKALLKTDWKIRAITRNTSSASAQALSASGVEVVTASFEDEASLVKAYEGVEAIFLVTNFWEHMFAGKTAQQSGEAEAQQALTVVKIADKLPGLKHFIWSTLPGNAEGQKPRQEVLHFDFKAKIDVTIKNEYPALAAKTTYLYVGYYANNLANPAFARLISTPLSPAYLWLQPTSRKCVIPSAGDVTINTGVFARAILAKPELTLTKYVACVADTLTHEKIVEFWIKATGKQAVFLEVNGEDWNNAFGEPGKEIWANLKAFEENDRWAFDHDPLEAKDLGIEGEVVGTEACLVSLGEKLL